MYLHFYVSKAIMVTYYYICNTIIRSLLVIFFGTVVKVTRGSNYVKYNNIFRLEKPFTTFLVQFMLINNTYLRY